MKLSEYNYDLPKSLIATKPPKLRGTSRLLVLDRKTGAIQDKKYANIIEYLNPGDTLILNDTKVIKARLRTTRQNGDEREIIILEKHSFDSDWHHHRILYRKKLVPGEVLSVGDKATLIVDEVLGDGTAEVHSDCDLLDLANKYGEMPLPPYMHRKATLQDVLRYQTIWANQVGSVAAPTASLNMTDVMLTMLKEKGIRIAYVTLHVGLGTFLPIRTDLIEEHHMHKEYFEIPIETVDVIKTTKFEKKRVVALGTTVARTLEYASDLLKNQDKEITGEADIFIYPGYKFKTIDCLITNTHAPKSTVLMLTAAFAGWDKLLPAYKHAIDERYHFLSYGDSMLIL